jgi:hypothetical protein
MLTIFFSHRILRHNMAKTSMLDHLPAQILTTLSTLGWQKSPSMITTTQVFLLVPDISPK